jgi:HSP20 family protein
MIRWEPVPFNSEVSRLFNSFFDTPTTARNGISRSWIPAMDVVEAEGEYVLKADLPGLSEQDVQIQVDANVLTVSGERKAEHEQKGSGYHRVERSYGSFSRRLTLPEGTDPEAVKASFDNGVLEVHIPKPEVRKPHTVAIAVGGTEPALETAATAGETVATAGETAATAGETAETEGRDSAS